LLRARPDATLVAITGTNGKSTTTALVGHILHHAGRTAEIGGNIGKPALELEPLGHGGVYVLEFSSYQLDLTPSLSADVSVLINLSPDHLDRHGGMDGYIRAKTRVFTGQRDGATAIIGVDDADCRKLSAGLSNPIAISGRQQIVGGVHVHDSQLVDDRGGAGRVMLDMLEAPALPGDHNAQNAAAAAAVTLSLGLDREAVARGIASFPGLAHRQERVAEISGVLYINDSKATNAEAAAHALACYDAIYWILGGLGKEGGLTPLADKLAPVRHAFLIGAASEQFATELDGQVPTTSCGTLDLALEKAHRMAQDEHPSGATVLLSPAAASFDQFPDFEARGDRFRTLVHARMAS
ncbi:MAG: UDP-N-acetylmuramoyl-L-alanine--D-glutamate ligase, partial [Rhodospirillaceae bacterium]|nr:UDP-N-acetylmuramoyl-L-alanine--D-glutamate ligase [Rhodospirillaceae bacterium]